MTKNIEDSNKKEEEDIAKKEKKIDDPSIKIRENFNIFVGLCKKLDGERSKSSLSLINHFDIRLAMCPASCKKDYHCSFPGGLVIHSLRTYYYSKLFLKFYQSIDAIGEVIDQNSLLITTLFHDIGKLGDLDNDFYMPQDDSWRREKLGECYRINEIVGRMQTSHRTLWILQHFGISLSKEEWLAIALCDGPTVKDFNNESYFCKEPLLAYIVHSADRLATLKEKGITSILDPKLMPTKKDTVEFQKKEK